MDYKNGKIYRIVCEETGRQYIGSTTSTLVKRLSNHIRNKKNKCACKDFINPKIFLLEDYPCERKDQLLMRERYWIENMDCVNLKRPIETKEEEKIRKSIWTENNKQRVQQTKQEWYIRNKEKQLKKCKQRYLDNKDEHNKKSKEYYKKIKERLLEKITCECGSVISRGGFKTHLKSKKHQSFIT